MELKHRFAEVDGLRLHYLESGHGEGAPVLLLHGWPTSSFLWRNVMPGIAQHRRVIALDLPGFGRSDKPLDASYSFRYFEKTLSGFIDALGLEKVGLAVHDLGGPVGLYWASRRPQVLDRLAVLNTIVYPEMSWAVVAFVAACKLPVVRSVLSSPWGLRRSLLLGVHQKSKLRDDAVAGTQAPFADRGSRKALLKAGGQLSPKGFRDIAAWIPTIQVPVQIIYGQHDRILPDIDKTVARLRHDLPQAQVLALPDCGHFLQEERPEEVGDVLARFFAATG